MTIFQKIGSFFSTNLKNGNIAKYTTAAGATAFTVGAAGAFIHSMNNTSCDRGIFSYGGGGCCGGGYFGGGYMNMPGYGPLNDPQLQHLMYCNPMGITNTPYAQATGYSNNFGGYNAYPNYSALNQMYSTMFLQNNLIDNNKTKHEYAGDLDKNQDTKAGKALDSALNAMVDSNNNIIAGKSVQIVDFSGKTTAEEKKAAYKEQISELGKSFLKNMDSNGDGIVSKEEYVASELKSLPDSATAEGKEAMTRAANNAFAKIDQNGDGKLDWKETAALLQTFDRNPDNGKSIDGKITSEEFANWSTKMANGTKDTFDKFVRNSYEDLFG